MFQEWEYFILAVENVVGGRESWQIRIEECWHNFCFEKTYFVYVYYWHLGCVLLVVVVKEE